MGENLQARLELLLYSLAYHWTPKATPNGFPGVRGSGFAERWAGGGIEKTK